VPFRNLNERKLAGVCAATAAMMGLRPWVIRTGFATAMVLTAGFAFFFYGVLWMLIPYERRGRMPAMQVFEPAYEAGESSPVPPQSESPSPTNPS
jgi:phage shock protein PspC (stress-responsive transcriptional regulator)